MKKTKQKNAITPEFLRDVVEITSRISSWFGFKIVSRTHDEDQTGPKRIANYKEVGMSHDEYGDSITINFEDKTIYLEQRYFNAPQLNLNFGTMKHLNERDRSALLALACEFDFMYDHEQDLEGPFGCDCEEEEQEEETMDNETATVQ